jgi:hypothetical protein
MFQFVIVSERLCFFICTVRCFKGILFFVAHNVTLRKWASWSDRSFIRDVDDDFSLLLTTNILSMTVLQPY